MKLLFFRWSSYMRWGIERALARLNIEYDVFDYNFSDWEQDEQFCEEFAKAVERGYELVLSVNFAPLVSEVCSAAGVRYVSWVYDAPLHIRDLTPLLNDCNEIYFFDKMQAAEFAAAGVRAFHLPLAADPEVFEPALRAGSGAYKADISMVGKLYQTEFGYYSSVLEPYLKGYLEGIVSAQSKLYGAYIIPELVTKDLLSSMNACYAKVSGGKFEMGKRELEYMLACEVTSRERKTALTLLAARHDTVVYSNETIELPGLRFGGYADYLTQMPRIFGQSSINLNISLKAIQTGIPLRVLDIMACGGFVLTNYQVEIEELLEPGKCCVFYDSIEDMQEKAEYYLKHESEKAAIAQAGRRLVEAEFSFENRLKTLIAEEKTV